MSTQKPSTPVPPPFADSGGESACGVCSPDGGNPDVICLECQRESLQFAADKGWLDPEPGETVH